MKILNCPLNGPRNISEFAYGGEVETHPDPHACSDAEWTDFVFFERNAASVVREWWCHVPSASWFIAERDTVSDEIVRTYPAAEVFAKRMDFRAPARAANGGDKP